VSKDEVHRVIKESSKEKAPNPDGFIDSFSHPTGALSWRI
jgi:hypothetical protein